VLPEALNESEFPYACRPLPCHSRAGVTEPVDDVQNAPVSRRAFCRVTPAATVSIAHDETGLPCF